MTRHQLEAELAAARTARADLDTVIRWLEQRLTETPPNGAASPVVARQRLGKPTAASAAQAVLEAHSAPMKIGDLAVAARKKGAQIKDGGSLSKQLTRNPMFVRVGRGMWALKQ